MVSASASGGAQPSAAYDFVATRPYIKDQAAAQKFSRTARLPEKLVLNTAPETVALFHQQWKKEAKNLPLTRDVVSAVEHQLRIVPLATDTR